MRLAVVVALAALTFTAACEKKKDGPAASKPAPESVAADGTRVIPIVVNDDGYDPSKIRAKAGQKLELVFTRKAKGACSEQVKIGDGAPVTLPVGEPVKIAVNVPASGEVKFACGMDMLTGVIVVE